MTDVAVQINQIYRKIVISHQTAVHIPNGGNLELAFQHAQVHICNGGTVSGEGSGFAPAVAAKAAQEEHIVGVLSKEVAGVVADPNDTSAVMIHSDLRQIVVGGVLGKIGMSGKLAGFCIVAGSPDLKCGNQRGEIFRIRISDESGLGVGDVDIAAIRYRIKLNVRRKIVADQLGIAPGAGRCVVQGEIQLLIVVAGAAVIVHEQHHAYITAGDNGGLNAIISRFLQDVFVGGIDIVSASGAGPVCSQGQICAHCQAVSIQTIKHTALLGPGNRARYQRKLNGFL